MMPEPTYPRPWLRKFNTLNTDVVDCVIKALAREGPMHFGPDTPPLSEKPIIRRRDALTYRGRALGFHIDLLKVHLQGFTRQANANMLDQRGRHDLLHDCRLFLTFCLDDILFNSISLLDYTGNLVGCILSGENCQGLNWNGALKAASDPSNPIHGTAAGKMIISINSSWADRLHGVRSRVIHHGISLGDGSQTLTFGQEKWEAALSFTVPAAIVSKLLFLKALKNDKGEVEIVAGAEAIVLNTLDAASKMILALLDDLGGRLKPATPA